MDYLLDVNLLVAWGWADHAEHRRLDAGPGNVAFDHLPSEIVLVVQRVGGGVDAAGGDAVVTHQAQEILGVVRDGPRRDDAVERRVAGHVLEPAVLRLEKADAEGPFNDQLERVGIDGLLVEIVGAQRDCSQRIFLVTVAGAVGKWQSAGACFSTCDRPSPLLTIVAAVKSNLFV